MKKTAWLLLISMLFTAVFSVSGTVSVGAADVDADLIGYYKFDGDLKNQAGGEAEYVGSTFSKASGNPVYKTGVSDSAFYVSTSAGNGLKLDCKPTDDNFTVSFWAKAESCNFAAPVIWMGSESHTDPSYSAWVGLWADFDGTAWSYAPTIGSNDSKNSKVGAVPDKGVSDTDTFNWTYVTFTVKDGYGVLYYNGAEVANTVDNFSRSLIPGYASGSATTLPAMFGEGGYDDAAIYVAVNAWDVPATMYYDELKVYNTALDADAVKTLYEAYEVTPELDGEPDAEDPEESVKPEMPESTIGDDGIEYHVRPVKDGAYTVSAEKYNSYQSEHFQVLWGDNNNSAITETWLEGNCKILEDCWDLYVNDLGMSPPSLCTNKTGDQTTHYKVNVIIMNTGIAGYGEGWAFAGIDSQGYAYLMCDQAAMVYKPETWVTPHEFGHVTQFAQGFNSWSGGTYLGSWYEAVANWYREQYLASEYYTSGEGYSTEFSYFILRAASLTATNGRAYYEAWPFLQYLTENPDGLEGYGSNFVAKLLQNGSPSKLIYNMIEDQAEADLSDTLGYYAAHMATLDLSRQSNYLRRVNSYGVAYEDFFWQQFYTKLEHVIGTENVYTVPSERAPQQAAYVVTPLTVTGDEIEVTLRGLTEVKGAGWRACIVTVKGDETVYSELFGDGETMKVSAKDVDEAYLTVAATPDLKTYKQYDAFTQESTLSFFKKNRYPYEVELTGAVPSEYEISKTGVKGDYHVNGGGFVASTAKVADSVYVGPDAMVLGKAVIKGDVRIEDHAVVMGSAYIKDNVVVDGNAIVAGSAKLSDNAHVGDYAVVSGSASVSGNGQVLESAYVYGSYKISENGIAKGLSLLTAAGQLSGQGVADGDTYDDSGATHKKGTVTGYLTLSNDSQYVRKLKYEENLYLGYDFDDDDGATTAERYSSTYALVRGAEWLEGGYYGFDGESQYIILDGSAVSSRDLQIVLNVKWDGTASGEKVFWFDGEEGYMYLTPSNDKGRAEFVIKKGDEEVKLTAAAALPAGEWTEVVITFAEGKAALTVAGNTEVCIECSLLPYDVCEGSGYLGRGADGGYYEGQIDYVNFYFTNDKGVGMDIVEALPDAEDTEDSATGTDDSTTDAPEEKGCGSSMSAAALIVAVSAVLGCALIEKKR